MAQQLHGSCLCKAIKVTVKDMAFSNTEGLEVCYCTNCRQSSGSIGAFLIWVKVEDFEISGEPKTYAMQAESGRTVTRHFCGTCGCAVYDIGGFVDRYCFHGGLFPPGSLPAPTLELWTRSTEHWQPRYPATMVIEKQ